MTVTQLPQRLQEEFERTARLLYDRDSIARALIEAVELWLAQHRKRVLDTERSANDRAYEALKAGLERDRWGKWIVIAEGALEGVGDTLEEVDNYAPAARDRIVMRVGEKRPKEVEFGWQMAFV